MARNPRGGSPEQLATIRVEALAARRRIQRLRAGLADGTLAFEQLLQLDPDDELATQAGRLEVQRLLRWIPGIGHLNGARVLNELRILPATRVATLTHAERRRIAAAVEAVRELR